MALRAVADVKADFQRRMGRPATVVARAPGRVNIIGEHTDYNEGFVFPMALEQCTWVAAAPRTDGQLRVAAAEVNDEQQWPRGAWSAQGFPGWTNYVAGVETLVGALRPGAPGADVLIASDVPVGSGLSSSAALEVSAALAFAALGGVTLEGQPLADLARRAEHEYAHVPCGIMDQYVSVLARRAHAFLLDCRSRTWEHVPLRLGDAVVLVVNSGVRHALASGEYAVRQKQCQAAVAYFRQYNPAVRALRDVTSADVEAHRQQLEPLVAARARHVTTEDERTQAAAAALRKGDLETLGRLLYASHESLRRDYEVSCPELDLLVDIVRGVPGAYGARMTGGGFGGCIVAIVKQAAVPAVTEAVRARYDAAGHGPSYAIVTQPGPGAALEFRA